MSDENDRDELNRLRAENAELRARSGRGVYLKVSEKGGVSVYGLGRFPVTLYQEQWMKILDMGEEQGLHHAAQGGVEGQAEATGLALSFRLSDESRSIRPEGPKDGTPGHVNPWSSALLQVL